MDEMKLRLSTKLLKGIVAKIIARSIYKKTGCKIDILINDLDIDFIDGQTSIHTNVEAKLNSNEFKKLIKSFDSTED